MNVFMKSKLFQIVVLVLFALGLIYAQGSSFKIAYTGSAQGRIGPCG